MSTARWPLVAWVACACCSPALAAERPRFGGELRVLIPNTPLDPDRFDPVEARTPLDLTLTRLACEPLLRETAGGVQGRLLLAPEGDSRGRLLTLRLRSGLRFSNASPLRAREVVESLLRLGTPESPFRALLVPVGGGHGLTARSETEIGVSFDFPYPDWPLALTHPGTCPVGVAHGKVVGRSGPFAPEGKIAAPALRLNANPEAPCGRPYADKLALRSTASRANATRAMASGSADLSLLPVSEPPAIDGPLAFATYLVINPARAALAEVPSRLAAWLDRAELVRTYVRAPAVPLYGLLAPSVEPHPVPPPALGPPLPLLIPIPPTGELLVEFGMDEQRAVADRLQVKLHDLGVDLKVVALPRGELFGRLARGEFDAAVASVPALPEAGLNLAQVLLLAGQEAEARSELGAIGAVAEAAGRRERASARAKELMPSLPLVPLYAQGLSVAARAAVLGLRFDTSGSFDPGDLWLQDAR